MIGRNYKTCLIKFLINKNAEKMYWIGLGLETFYVQQDIWSVFFKFENHFFYLKNSEQS